MRKKRELHGDTYTIEYKIWAGMRRRCSNPNEVSYQRYGGRGIAVCDKWNNSFEAFLEDVGPRPGPEYSLERIDNDRGYEPGNVKWATYTEQNRNTSRTRFVDYQGRKVSLPEFAEITGQDYMLMHHRYTERGITNAEDLLKEAQPQNSTEVTFRGQTATLMEWGRRLNIPYLTLYMRIHQYGWSVEKALTTPIRESSRWHPDYQH